MDFIVDMAILVMYVVFWCVKIFFYVPFKVIKFCINCLKMLWRHMPVTTAVLFLMLVMSVLMMVYEIFIPGRLRTR